ALGGIDVRFPYPSRDAKSGLDVRETGCRHLNGGRALALARSRYFSYQVDGVWHSDPWADLGRIRRQQAFLQALIKAALDKGLPNPVRANAFAGSLVHEVTKDSALRVSEVIRTGAAFRSFRPSKLATYTLPVTVGTEHPLGDVLLLKQPEAQSVVNTFLGRDTPTPEPPPGAAAPASTNVSLPPPHVAHPLRPRPPPRRQDPRHPPRRRRQPHRGPDPQGPQPHPHHRLRVHRHPPPCFGARGRYRRL